MSKKKRGGLYKLRLFFSKPGKPREVSVNVNEEYRKAFRTKSYNDICTRIAGEIETIRSSEGPDGAETCRLRPSDGVIETQQEALILQFQGLKIPQFSVLVNYLETSLDACRICESLHANVRQARLDNDPIRAVIELSKRDTWSHEMIRRNFIAVSCQTNPFSPMTPEKFRELHARHASLLRSLTAQRKKAKRRAGVVRLAKRAMASFFVLGSVAVAVAALILAMHTLAAAPALAVCGLSLFAKVKKRKWVKAAGALDVAARGVYIMINEFDTVSRLVRRVEDEAEHRRLVAGACVRRGGREMAREVVRELEAEEAEFMDQLEELERQICLCFLDIHRSRRLLVREIVKWW